MSIFIQISHLSYSLALIHMDALGAAQDSVSCPRTLRDGIEPPTTWAAIFALQQAHEETLDTFCAAAAILRSGFCTYLCYIDKQQNVSATFKFIDTTNCHFGNLFFWHLFVKHLWGIMLTRQEKHIGSFFLWLSRSRDMMPCACS